MMVGAGTDWTGALVAVLLDVVVLKGSVLILSTVVLCSLARDRAASLRAGLWGGLFLTLLVLPFGSLARGPVSDGSGEASRRTDAGPGGAPAAAVALNRPASEPGVSGATAVRSAPAVPEIGRGALVRLEENAATPWLLALWLGGAALVLGTRIRASRAVQRLAARSRGVPPVLLDRIRKMSAQMDLPRVPRAVSTSGVTVPSVFGLRDPVLLLPVDVEDWSPAALDSALLHELAHLRRRDYAVHIVAQVVAALYWPNPFVRYASERLHRERERACDDGVVTRTGGALDYAELLVLLARRSAPRQPLLSFSDRSSLAERVRSLLDATRPRESLGPWRRAGLVAAVPVVLVAAMAMDLVAVVAPDSEAMQALSDPDPAVRQRAAWSLGEGEHATSVPPLLDALGDEDPRVRRTAAWALGEIKVGRALGPLSESLRDPDPLVREMAVLAIGEIEHDDGLAHLRSMDPGAVAQEALDWAFAQIRGTPAPEVFTGTLNSGEPTSLDRGRLEVELLEGTSTQRAQAAVALGRMGQVSSVSPLLAALDDVDPAVRARAIWALDEINPSRERP